MTIAEFREAQAGLKAVIQDLRDHPRAWILSAIPVWNCTYSQIAAFDTMQAGLAYFEASKLSNPVTRTGDPYVRHFRPDSLLWNYDLHPKLELPDPLLVLDGVVENPVPPPPKTGKEILDMLMTAPLGNYGIDCDAGSREPLTNMDPALPKVGIEVEKAPPVL